MALKIATCNVNGVNGRLPRLLEWLRETSPDIVCLQELKTDDSKFPAGAIANAGYVAIWHGQRAHHGVAILAKGGMALEICRGLPNAYRSCCSPIRRRDDDGTGRETVHGA